MRYVRSWVLQRQSTEIRIRSGRAGRYNHRRARGRPALSARVEIGKDLHQRPYVIKLDGARGVYPPLATLCEEPKTVDPPTSRSTC